MWTAAGPRWTGEGFVEGHVSVEGGRIVAVGSGAPAAPDARGVLVPSFVNAHTHVGDRFARGRIPDGIALPEAVEPPDGLKYRLLAAATAEEVRDGVRAALAEARRTGTRVVYDFREGGVAGATTLREGAEGTGVLPVVLLAPAGREIPDEEEASAMAKVADGFGLSAVRDVTPAEARAHAAAARRAGLRFALHWAEGVHEPLEDVLACAPDFVVHAVQATPADLARLAEARVPVVSCPRSNLRLVGELPDVRAWLDAGLDVCLGSDNAMLQTVSMLDELRFARAALPDVAPAELLRMAVDAPRARLGVPGAMRAWQPGEPADFVVLRAQGSDPYAAVFAPEAEVAAWAPRA